MGDRPMSGHHDRPMSGHKDDHDFEHDMDEEWKEFQDIMRHGGADNNILNVNFAPINTNEQNWININTEVETDINVNSGKGHHHKPEYGYEKPPKPESPAHRPKFDFDGLLDWLEEEINDCEEEDERDEIPPMDDHAPIQDDYADPTTLANDVIDNDF